MKSRVVLLLFIVFFFFIWRENQAPLFLYNRSPSVNKGWYLRQYFLPIVTCSRVYLAIKPEWIEERYPRIAKSLEEHGSFILKFLDTKTSRSVFVNKKLPMKMEVFASMAASIDSQHMGSLSKELVRGAYCFIPDLRLVK